MEYFVLILCVLLFIGISLLIVYPRQDKKQDKDINEYWIDAYSTKKKKNKK